MKYETFKKICSEKKLDFETVEYNCGFAIKDLKLYKGEIFKPCFYINGKPSYKFLAQYEIDFADCV